MNYEIISSSSKGNCIIVEKFLMLDCGLSYSKIKQYLKDIKLIFISHIHSDHLKISTIKQLTYYKPTIKYICGNEEVLNKLVQCGVNKKNVYMLKNAKWYDLKLLKVKIEQLYHDAPNNALKWQINDKKGIYIVDTCSVDNISAKNYDLYCIEANYDEETLKNHIQKAIEEHDDNKLYYLNRVPYTHLSIQKCNDFLIENMGSNSFYQLIHKSNYNYEEGEE